MERKGNVVRSNRARILIVALLAVWSVALVQCGGDSDSDGGDGEDAPPPAATQTETPDAADDDNGDNDDNADLFGGKTVGEFYTANCAACHGNDRQGVIGPALLPDTLIESDELYAEAIADGRPGTAMPSWTAAGMSEAEISAMVTWLKTDQP